MCGIAGFIANTSTDDAGPRLQSMTDAIEHRGPDAEGHAFERAGDACVALGHRRLSIIDLEASIQPFVDAAAGLTLIFNGEIYNFQSLRDELRGLGHSFRTAGDTEVILRAYAQWGTACAQRLRGMFAFAVWDARQQRLYMARDRFGQKPLFIAERGGAFVFASEIKALLAGGWVTPQVDMGGLWDLFAYRYAPAPHTLFDGIRKMPPASWMTWQAGVTHSETYWHAPDRDVLHDPIAIDDSPAALRDALDEAVRLRMVADVPFGAFLSGGLDSSIIVALMARHSSERVKTFSVGFPVAEYSELDHAQTVAEHVGTEHHAYTVTDADMMDKLPTLIGYRDAPVCEPSDVPVYLLSQAARREVKMVLTGEGSDELLAGYPKHAFERYVPWYQMIPGPLRRSLIEPLVRALPFRFRRAKTAITNLGLGDVSERYPRWFGALSQTERAELVALSAPQGHAADAPPFASAPGNSALRRVLHFDQTSWLPDNLLERGDRMTMAVGLEARMPFMDHEFAATASRLPDAARLKGHTGKWALRQAAAELIPPHILTRPKVGFRVPVDVWFRGPMRDMLCDHLLGADARTASYFHRPALERVVAEHVDNRQNHEKLLWLLLNLELWQRQYGL
ncbi:asparagine synthase (glutamine-hydrolyzing) [bacterium]|nr:asparagine synthase (glutamine-hydrolyzing) [bacterium]